MAHFQSSGASITHTSETETALQKSDHALCGGRAKIAILTGGPKGAGILTELLGTNGNPRMEKARPSDTYPERGEIYNLLLGIREGTGKNVLLQKWKP